MGLDACVSCDCEEKGRACEHEGGFLVHEYLGNITRIGLVVEGLSQHEEQFPVTLEKVVYTSTHAGDDLSLSDVALVAEEVRRGASLPPPEDPRVAAALRFFFEQMTRLTEAALAVGKPISF